MEWRYKVTAPLWILCGCTLLQILQDEAGGVSFAMKCKQSEEG